MHTIQHPIFYNNGKKGQKTLALTKKRTIFANENKAYT